MPNDMRDRLIELFYENNVRCDQTVEGLADDIVADGWIRPPCKVGDTVWFIRNLGQRDFEELIETQVEKIVLKSGGIYLKLACNAMYETTCNSIGKTVFLTKEEAENALKERGQNG